MSGILGLLLGRTLCDRYRVDSVIATGGMGAVCRAFDLRLERDVAVKVVTAPAADDDDAARLRARFHREATAAARLRHPNVVTVHDFGTDPALGIDFLVMELLAGEDLAARMRRAGGPLAVEECVEILREGGMGLAAGHRAGMIHRDVKPGNIYLVAEPGGWEVKLLDFGIAQVRADGGDGAARLTQFASPHTPRYASPEQLSGDARLTPATDVFSLALTALEMLAGERPDGLNATGDDKAAARFIRRLVQRRPEVPLRLAAVLRRSLRLDPAMRFPNADALLDELEGWDAAPSDGAAAGYASILPGAAPRSAAAESDHTLLAGAAPDDGTALAPPPLRRGPRVSPPAPLAAAVSSEPTSPAAAQPDGKRAAADAKPRRRIRGSGWLVLALLACVLVLAFAVVRRPARPRHEPPREEAPAPAPTAPDEPAGGRDLADAEFDRVRADRVFGEGDVMYVVVLASETPDQEKLARGIRDEARAKGYEAGLANSAVYPELRDGYIVVVAGPYAGRDQARAALPDLRRDTRPDAFVKRVTLHKP